MKGKRLAEAWRLLRQRGFLPVLSAMILAGAGRWIASVVIPLWVLSRTGSAFSMSMSLIMEMLPAVFVGPLFGLLVDRVNRKSLLLLATVGRAACIWGMAAGSTIWILYAAVFAEATLAVLAGLSISSLIPDIVGHENITPANAAHGSVISAMRLIGPTMAGALLLLTSYQVALFAAGALIVVAAIPYSMIRLQVYEHPHTEPTGLGQDLRATMRALMAGLAYSLRSRPLRVLMTVNTIFSLAIGGVLVVLPLIATHVLGSSAQYGTMMTVFGLGLLVGSAILAMPVLTRTDKPSAFAGLTIAFGLLCVPLALARGYFAVMFTVLLMGLSEGVSEIAYEVIRQEDTPCGVRGRVFASQDAAVALLFPIGAAGAGAFIGSSPANAAPVALAAGLTLIAAGVLGLFMARQPEADTPPLGE